MPAHPRPDELAGLTAQTTGRDRLTRDMARSPLDGNEESVRYFGKLTGPRPDAARSGSCR